MTPLALGIALTTTFALVAVLTYLVFRVGMSAHVRITRWFDGRERRD